MLPLGLRIPVRIVLATALRAIALAAVLTGPLIEAPAAHAQKPFDKGELTIVSGGKPHKFSIEIARTRDERAQGLMWRRKVPAGTGMLFLHPADRVLQMWMKNTFVPLDMLFIDSAGRIVRIKERTVPQSTAIISSGKKARAVLELAGGTVSRLGFKPGDQVLHEAFSGK